MSKQQVDYICEVVSKHITIFDKKRQLNKFLSFGIKLTSATLAAAITVLLGLTVSAESKIGYANIALTLSAVIAILNTWDAFFNHKALWVRFTITTQSLRSIREELGYLLSKTQGNPTEEQIESLYGKFKQVMLTIDRDWENLRKEERGQDTP
jgi:hypothetical protein